MSHIKQSTQKPLVGGSKDGSKGPSEPIQPTKPVQMKDYIYICVLDFEGTCWKTDKKKQGQETEIIEFPSVMVKWDPWKKRWKRIGEFQRYVKPIINPKLTDFCTELTGITQEKVDRGTTFEKALQDHETWLRKTINASCGNRFATQKDIYILTVGQWDMQQMLTKEMRRRNKDYSGIHSIYKTFVNIKNLFADHYDPPKGSHYGMKGMLDYLNIELKGHHHSGIDDCRNTASILEQMMKDDLKLNTLRKNNQFIKYKPKKKRR